ncbi:hypothetical protein T07_13091 [Trichinella nelsoni]|uniref:Uncharacterized protein n=1 Tax=Trichinella nelsoni TaxID=6336 RepID=A0A0V0RG30_9BILA|nr:hypothetical protein T07_13091 [Trichinella nelsoni]
MTDCMAPIHQLQVYNRWLCLGHDRNGQTGAGWTRKRAESLRWKRLSLFYKVDSHVQLFVDALDRWPATVHHGGNSLEAAVRRRQVAWSSNNGRKALNNEREKNKECSLSEKEGSPSRETWRAANKMDGPAFRLSRLSRSNPLFILLTLNNTPCREGKNCHQVDQCTKAEGKNELYHEEDGTPSSVGSTRRHSFLLPQEASIDPASFQFNILSTGKVQLYPVFGCSLTSSVRSSCRGHRAGQGETRQQDKTRQGRRRYDRVAQYKLSAINLPPIATVRKSSANHAPLSRSDRTFVSSVIGQFFSSSFTFACWLLSVVL